MELGHEINPADSVKTSLLSTKGSATTSTNRREKDYKEWKRKHALKARWRDSIWPEFLSILGSVCCLAAMITVLKTMDNKPLQSWIDGHAPIQLNTAVSALSTALKALVSLTVAGCMSQLKWIHFRRPQPMFDLNVFDAASRGPGGSLNLLTTRHTAVTVASLGAVMTILLLPVDPFTQQLIKPVIQLAVVPGSVASFGYTTIYDNRGRVDGATSEIELYDSDTSMQGAILGGLYGLQYEPTFNCESANCAWPDNYTMLGFQGSCSNVTAQVTYHCVDDDTNIGETSCLYTTPSNLTVTTDEVPTDYNTLVAINSRVYLDGFMDHDLLEPGIPTSSTILNFAVYRVTTANQQALDNVDEQLPWEMIECSLDLVSFNYAEVTVQSNKFQVGNKQTGTLNADTQYINIESSTIFNFTSKDGSSLFQVNIIDWNILARFLQDSVFSGAIYAGESFPTNSTSIAPAALTSANITAIVENIAAAMTSRLGTSLNHTQAQGHVLQNETFVTVQWPFLALHTTIIVGAAVFLAITGVKVFASQERLWKDSNVALICHQVADWDGHEALQYGPSVLEERSKHVRIQFVNGADFHSIKPGKES